MDQPCTSETWSRPQSSWPYKISAEQKWQHGGIQFFWCRWIKLIPNNIRSSCSPRISYQEIFTDWITKESKPYCIKKRETVLVQVMKDVSKQVKLTVWKNRMKYEFLLPIGKNLRKVLIEKGVSPYSAFNNKINCRGNGLCATCGVFVMDSDLLRHTGMIVSPELLDIPDSVVRLKSRRIWKSKFLQNGYGEKEKKERFECCDDLFPRLGIHIIL